MIVCGVQVTLKLNFNAMWQKPIFCVPEIGWEYVISLPSEVASGSLLRLLKFLLVFKLAVRFAAGSALVLMRRAPGPVLVSSLRKVVICCGPWSRSTTLAMSSWLSGMERNFAEKLDLCYFSFHAADFPSSAILNSFQELCHRTRRLKSSFARNGYPPLHAVDTMYLYQEYIRTRVCNAWSLHCGALARRLISSNVTFAYCTKWCIGVVVLRGRPLTHVRNLSMKPEPFYRAFSFFFLHENSQRGW